MFPVQRRNERGTPLLGTRAKCIVVWIWRHVVLPASYRELRFFSQQVDDFANQVPSNTEMGQDSFVL
jgi:hypothetical protein